jgi:hypothetical protein
VLLACSCLISPAISAAGEEATFELAKIDGGKTWMTPYWGYNAPKLVFDGKAYYTIGLWGSDYNTAKGFVYKLDRQRWIKGAAFDQLRQPPMLLLDGKGRILIVYRRVLEAESNGGEAPMAVLRSRAPGDILNFDALAPPPRIAKAVYIGAGVWADRMVVCFCDEDYDFHLAVLNLGSLQWNDPVVLKKGRRAARPYTAWLYPVVIPDSRGVHLLVSNADSDSSYNRIGYLYPPWDVAGEMEMEQIFDVAPGKLAFGQAMWICRDGGVNVVGLWQPLETMGLYVFRRDPETGRWVDTFLKKSPVGLKPGDETLVKRGRVIAGDATRGSVGTLFEDAAGRLWLPATAGDHFDLYLSEDQGRAWKQVRLGGFEPYDLKYAYFMHGLRPSSGSASPAGPRLVFTTSLAGGYETWFMQIHVGSSN